MCLFFLYFYKDFCFKVNLQKDYHILLPFQNFGLFFKNPFQNPYHKLNYKKLGLACLENFFYQPKENFHKSSPCFI
jgi:hypothetical protein